jgi:YD repeat-containing protein
VVINLGRRVARQYVCEKTISCATCLTCLPPGRRLPQPCASVLAQGTKPPSQTEFVSDNKPSEPPVVCQSVMEQLPKCQTFVSRFNYAAAGKIESNPDEIRHVACAGVDPSFSYDILNRLTSMTSPAGTTSYHYDPVIGRLDRITSPEGMVFSFTYNKGRLGKCNSTN